MDSADASLDLLAHFDAHRWPTATAETQTRNVAWVLHWAVALVSVALVAGVLMEFAYCVAAEQALMRAARAGAIEATLPRASQQTIESTIARRLAAHPQLTNRLRLSVHLNSAPALRTIQPRPGDHLIVALAVPRHAASPPRLARLNFWRRDAWLEARAEHSVPSRYLTRPTD